MIWSTVWRVLMCPVTTATRGFLLSWTDNGCTKITDSCIIKGCVNVLDERLTPVSLLESAFGKGAALMTNAVVEIPEVRRAVLDVLQEGRGIIEPTLNEITTSLDNALERPEHDLRTLKTRIYPAIDMMAPTVAALSSGRDKSSNHKLLTTLSSEAFLHVLQATIVRLEAHRRNFTPAPWQVVPSLGTRA
jgi:hypothetical protein